MNLKDLDLELVSDIRFVSGRTPFVIYSRFGQNEPVAIDLLKLGITGLLSIEASIEQHNMAIDTVMRGDSYVDANLKQNIVNALSPRLY